MENVVRLVVPTRDMRAAGRRALRSVLADKQVAYAEVATQMVFEKDEGRRAALKERASGLSQEIRMIRDRLAVSETLMKGSRLP